MQTARSVRLAAVLACVAGTLALASGCATDRPKAAEPIERLQILSELSNGHLRLSCDTACAASWRLARPTLKGLYDNKVWPDLAVEVARIGHPSDLAYFYLARAAEANGHPRAAELYFKLSRASPNRCDGWLFNSCDGVQLPAEATAGLARVGSP
jgi:hypothetical protein